MKVCVITDNEYIFENFIRLAEERKQSSIFDFYYSSFNKEFAKKYQDDASFRPIKLTEMDAGFFSGYDLFISLHCKQLFPKKMVENYRCINVHPGLNPYNRGWYPQVFSIINKLPAGVTIHEMDAELDHGPILFQREIEIRDYETSLDIYKKIQQEEIRLLEEHLDEILVGDYTAKKPENEGNINYKKDFEDLCVLDMERVGTFREFLDVLRATTFDKYNNAYFYDEHGDRIYVSITMKKFGGGQ